MEKKDVIRRFLCKYIKSDGSKHEAITKYVSVDEDLIKQDRKAIIDFFSENFPIGGLRLLYDELRYDRDLNEWIKLDNRRDLELFEQLIAVGYEAGVFHESIVLRSVEFKKITREELKYAIPEEFEYIDEDYYDGLNKGIIQKNSLYIDPVYYNNIERTCDTKDLLKYWFNKYNVPNAVEQCSKFQYLLENDVDLLVDVATYLHLQGANPLLLLFDLNQNINLDLIPQVEYMIKMLDPKQKEAFLREKEI